MPDEEIDPAALSDAERVALIRRIIRLQLSPEELRAALVLVIGYPLVLPPS